MSEQARIVEQGRRQRAWILKRCSAEWEWFADPKTGRRVYQVPASETGRFYYTTRTSCTCPDAEYRPELVCKHQASVAMRQHRKVA